MKRPFYSVFVFRHFRIIFGEVGVKFKSAERLKVQKITRKTEISVLVRDKIWNLEKTKMAKMERWVKRRTDGWVDGWIIGWMNKKWMDG